MKKLTILLVAIMFSGILVAQTTNTFKYSVTAPAIVLPGGDVQTQLDEKVNSFHEPMKDNLTDEEAALLKKLILKLKGENTK